MEMNMKQLNKTSSLFKLGKKYKENESKSIARRQLRCGIGYHATSLTGSAERASTSAATACLKLV